MNNQPLSTQLKEETHANHLQVEKLLIGLLRSIDNTNAYIKLLQIFYGYFGALEDKINQHIGVAQLADHSKRRKSESIIEDIKDLGGLAPEKAKDSDLPEIANHLQALGALYVIEGSTLGGKLIAKMLSKQLDIKDSNGLSFFSGYADKTDEMWEGFKHALNNEAQDSTAAALIIHAADETFVKFKLWIEKSC
ncbi:MAG: biliverdin-producing heme oxygenase [Sphingobacteriaceae bacterium]